MDVGSLFEKKGIFLKYKDRVFGKALDDAEININVGDLKVQVKEKNNLSALFEMFHFAMEESYKSEYKKIIMDLLDQTKLEDFIMAFQKSLPSIKRVRYVEDTEDILFSENKIVIPLISHESGELGSLIVEGEFDANDIIDFLLSMNSLISLVEGLILDRRSTEMLKSSLMALSKAMESRVKEGENLRKIKRKLLEKFKELYSGDKTIFELASYVYDVGLIGVKDAILQKSKDNLTKEELDEYKKHPIYGYEILKNIQNLPNEIIDASLYHHERLDGSGYPYGMKGDKIPEIALLIGFVDEVAKMQFQKLSEDEIKEKLVGKFPEDFLRYYFEVLR